jgi:histidine triad (HIT) family protein
MKTNMQKNDCIFCKILKGELPSRIFWEDDYHIALLTPFPNTPGFSVIVTKDHLSSYVADLSTEQYNRLFIAAKIVCKLLDEKLGTKRTGIIAEGMGINHAHIKLMPMHGIPDGDWVKFESNIKLYTEQYLGYLSSHDGPQASEEELDRVLNRLTN